MAHGAKMDLSSEQQEYYEERAAIMEFDGRLPRDQAEQLALLDVERAFRFNGPAYDATLDRDRLTGQILRIRDLMQDGRWRTLNEIADATQDPPASISAQLRHLRKPRFGGYTVTRRRRGEPAHGLWEYRLDEAETRRR